MRIVSMAEVKKAASAANKSLKAIPFGSFKTIKSFSGDSGYCNTWANELKNEAAKGTNEGNQLASDLVKSGSSLTDGYSRARKSAEFLKSANITVTHGSVEWSKTKY